MNEPWVNISTQVKTQADEIVKSIVATDRFGFRWMHSGTAKLEDDLQASRTLLLVEDSDDDAFLFEVAIKRSGKRVDSHRASSAGKARDYLSRQIPTIIALDCHMPGESGLDLLGEIRSIDSFCRVPVIMMSGTENDDELGRAYALGANSFLRKPHSCEEYLSDVNILLEYWLGRNITSLNRLALPHERINRDSDAVEGLNRNLPELQTSAAP